LPRSWPRPASFFFALIYWHNGPEPDKRVEPRAGRTPSPSRRRESARPYPCGLLSVTDPREGSSIGGDGRPVRPLPPSLAQPDLGPPLPAAGLSTSGDFKIGPHSARTVRQRLRVLTNWLPDGRSSCLPRVIAIHEIDGSCGRIAGRMARPLILAIGFCVVLSRGALRLIADGLEPVV